MASPLHLLDLPLELRYHIFRRIIYAPFTIEFGTRYSNSNPPQRRYQAGIRRPLINAQCVDLNPESGGPFEALALACRQLRGKIKDWFEVERKACKDLIWTRAFGLLHADKTELRAIFAHYESSPPTGMQIHGRIFRFLVPSKPLISDFHISTEIFGLWRDIVFQTWSNSDEELAKRIKWRLYDHGERELDLMSATWDFLKKQNSTIGDLIPSSKWKVWWVLRPVFPSHPLLGRAIGEGSGLSFRIATIKGGL